MTLQSLLKKSYYHLEVTFQQEKIAKLPYYGPLIRGMLGDTFSNDNVLSEVIFKNPRIDVRPYFFYTERNGNSVTAHLMLMGFSEHFIKEVVRAIGEKETAHIGGVKCVIGAMSLKKRSFMNRRIKKRFTGESVKEECDAGFPKPARKCPPSVGLSLFERVIQPSAGGSAEVLTVYTERRV